MNSWVLGTASKLVSLHGIRYAASYLCDNGVAVEVALELLASRRPEHDYEEVITQPLNIDCGATHLSKG